MFDEREIEPDHNSILYTKMVNIIQVDGIIGAGKSYFIEHILVPALTDAGYRVKVIREPVDQWDDILPLFYADKKRWASQFQMYALVDRIAVIKQAIQDHDQIDFYISERGITSDRLFMEVLYKEGNVTEMEMIRYGKWWNQWYSHMPVCPKTVIYLNTDIDVCMERVKSRARNGELCEEDSEDSGGVSKEYQLMLQAEHNSRYAGKTKIELVTWIKSNVVEITDVKNIDDWKVDIMTKLTPLLAAA